MYIAAQVGVAYGRSRNSDIHKRCLLMHRRTRSCGEWSAVVRNQLSWLLHQKVGGRQASFLIFVDRRRAVSANAVAEACTLYHSSSADLGAKAVLRRSSAAASLGAYSLLFRIWVKRCGFLTTPDYSSSESLAAASDHDSAPSAFCCCDSLINGMAMGPSSRKRQAGSPSRLAWTRREPPTWDPETFPVFAVPESGKIPVLNA